jgi:ribonuclease HI
MLIEVYSDGSATTADKPGGYAFVICVEKVKVAEGSGHLPKATNNVAEITAAISGLEYIATHDLPGVDETGEVVLVSDSKLVLGYADGSYQCKAMHLLPLMLKLRKLFRQVNATTRWERGHQGEPNNERCDELAKAAREGITSAEAPNDKERKKPDKTDG